MIETELLQRKTIVQVMSRIQVEEQQDFIIVNRPKIQIKKSIWFPDMVAVALLVEVK